jgi:peroxiredoxin Q/BCP
VRDEQPKYRKKAVRTFGVNPAAVASHEQYTAKFSFNFPLLSDPDGVVAAAYRAVKPGGAAIQRTVYLVGADGRVLFAKRGTPGVDEILAALG